MEAKKFGEDFYKKLYSAMCDYAENNWECDCADETTTKVGMELDVDNIIVCLTGVFNVEFVDDSFDHAFGTEYGWHMELRELDDIEIDVVYDEDGEDITEQFDENTFWEQFYCREIKLRNGSIIKTGETVQFFSSGVWRVMKFEYYDTLCGRYFGKTKNGANCSSRNIRKAS